MGQKHSKIGKLTRQKVDEIMKSGNPTKMIEDVMQSDQFNQVQKIAKDVENVLNIVKEQQEIINDNILTYVEYFKEIDTRLKAIEQHIQKNT